jgi:ribosome-binding protein aMBF1 (putative translation factor)
MNFTNMVKKVRKQLGMSQQQLAGALNVSFSTINRWENGHAVPSPLAVKSFIDFCDGNLIDASGLKMPKNGE